MPHERCLSARVCNRACTNREFGARVYNQFAIDCKPVQRTNTSLSTGLSAIEDMVMADDAGGDAEGGAAEDQEAWKASPAYMTGPNTPLKRAKRASPVWGMIKRLTGDHSGTVEGYTQTCIHAGCGCFLTPQKTKGNWATAKCAASACVVARQRLQRHRQGVPGPRSNRVRASLSGQHEWHFALGVRPGRHQRAAAGGHAPGPPHRPRRAHAGPANAGPGCS
jgi:hypothetical protein